MAHNNSTHLVALRRDAKRLLVPLRRLGLDAAMLLNYAQASAAGSDGIRREGARLVYALLNAHPSMLSLIATLDDAHVAADFSAELSLVASRLRLMIDRAAPGQLYPVALDAMALAIASTAWIGIWLDERGSAVGVKLIEGARVQDLRTEGRPDYPVVDLLHQLKDISALSIDALQVLVTMPPAFR